MLGSSRGRRIVFAVSWGAGTLGWACASGTAFAAERNVARLRYELDDIDEKCATESTFRARVIARLGYDPFRDDAALALRVRVVARGSTATAEITSSQTGKPVGKRKLTDPNCDALGESAASAVALLLDPVAAQSTPASPTSRSTDVARESALQRAPAAAPQSTPEPPDTAVLPADAPTAVAPSEALPSSHRAAPILYGDAAASFGRAFTTLLGVRVGGGLRLASFSVALEGRAETAPSSSRVSTVDRLDVSAFSGAVVPCGHVGRFQLCGVVTAGVLEVKDLDVVTPATHANAFAAIGVRPGFEWPLSESWAVRLNGEVGVPLSRTQYSSDGIVRQTASVVEGSLGAGILGRFR